MDTTFTEKQIMRDFDRRMEAAYGEYLKAVNDDPTSEARAREELAAKMEALVADSLGAAHEAAERLRADDGRNTVPDENGSEA